MKASIQAQMQELDSKMNASRKDIGAYCMLYLRNIFPENDTRLWDLLQSRISSDKALAGKGLWTNLSERVKAKPVTEDTQPT